MEVVELIVFVALERQVVQGAKELAEEALQQQVQGPGPLLGRGAP